MELFLIRLLVIAIFFLLFTYVFKITGGALLTAFVVEYILEPFITAYLNR